MQISAIGSTMKSPTFGTNVKSIQKYISKNKDFNWSNDMLRNLEDLKNDGKNRTLSLEVPYYAKRGSAMDTLELKFKYAQKGKKNSVKGSIFSWYSQPKELIKQDMNSIFSDKGIFKKLDEVAQNKISRISAMNYFENVAAEKLFDL